MKADMPAEPRNLGREHQLHGVQPVLPVSDVAASAEFFHQVLGRRLGVEVVFAPVSQPWGLREFAVRETNQRVLRFCMEA